MLKQLIQKATFAIATKRGVAPEPLPEHEEQLPQSWAEKRKEPAPVAAPTDALDMIVVPESALAAFPDNPRPLVDAVVGYVNFLLYDVQMHPTEVPVEAMQAYRCDAYHAQVCDGGHVKYIDTHADQLTAIISDLMGGLIGMGDAKYQRIAGDMATFVGSDKVTDKQEALTRLDQPFYVHDKKVRFTMVLAEWIADCEILLTVPDAMLSDVYAAIAGPLSRNAEIEIDAPAGSVDTEGHEAPLVLGRIAQFSNMLTDTRKLGFGLAGGSAKNPVVGLGGTLKMDVDGQMVPSTLIYAGQGQCWGLIDDKGAAFLAHDFDEEAEIAFVGEELSRVSTDDIDTVRDICTDLRAAAAIDLMIAQHDADLDIDFLSVHAITGDDPADPCLQIYAVYDGGAAAFMAEIDASGATLLAEPSHETLVTVQRVEIEEHAQDRASSAAA
ncbi:hypothetical protein [Yoonia sp. 208BN28-4]|uniref:hypothetical protein n=1 Tax=Yoonia sp. 208BN28-4 TaxID=3126505 RepID=UPI0030B2D524